jgi:ribosomal protein L9
MAAKVAGATTIIAIDVVPSRLALALELGATHVVNSRETDVVEAVAAQTGIELDRHSVHIDQAIKTVGTHSVAARLHPEVQFQITVEVSPA